MSPAAYLYLAAIAVIGALAAAIFGYISNAVRDRLDKKQRTIEEFEKLCDEFLRLVADYWASPIGDDNLSEMRLLRSRIVAMLSLLTKFYTENFEKNWNVRAALSEVQNAVTLHDFATEKRDADREKMARSIYAIVELRFSARK